MFTISDLSSRSSALSESLLLSCLDEFLVLPDFLVEVDLWDGRDHFALHLLDICIAGCNYSLLSVLLLVIRLVSVVVLWFAFACRWLCSSLAYRGLCSSRLFSSLHVFVFFSLSLYPCCFTSFLSPQARWLWFRVSDSHHWHFGLWFRL